MKIGYARVSTADWSMDRQLDQLKEIGCKKIFICINSSKLSSDS
ncbi:recombinase family protein [Clostridium kluyveri]|nr:recombinase family protein [Clostridium kluyveri]